MFCAAVLLTGGRSRRMGRDKATLTVAGRLGGPVTLAERTAELVAGVCGHAVEVGPGHTSLPAVTESPPGGGPLAAMVAGWRQLASEGWHGPVLVVATDLPNLTSSMVTWLAGRPGDRSVVPVAAGRVQPLCARYSPADMGVAARLVGNGQRAVMALLDSIEPELVAEDVWATEAGGPGVLHDVDTPDDLRGVTGL